MAQIAPSILSADFARLGEDVADVCAAEIDYLHIDVMDGMFVPNISFGSAVMKSLNGIATVPYDVHLMVVEPARYIADFLTDNTEFITVHAEACEDVLATIAEIHKLGVKAGISISPDTPVSAIKDILQDVELILVMSVYPGFGGQSFIAESLAKVEALAELRAAKRYDYIIEIDGGINAANAGEVRAAGADLIVAGSAVFGAEDRAATIKAIKGE